MNDNEYISHLLYHLVVGDLSEAGRRDLEKWALENDCNAAVYRRIQDPDYLTREYRRIRAVDSQRAMHNMEMMIARGYGEPADEKEEPRQHRGRTIAMWLGSVAAMAALVVGFYTYYNRETSRQAPAHRVIAQVVSSAITHGTTQAVLTLDNGDTLHLGGKAQRDWSRYGELKGSQRQSADARLKIATPRGGEFKVTLEDGTEVWLNAETQLQYPETFSGGERRVAVTGEAYFKVAKDAKRPFYVKTAGQVVRVYGTEFNIHAYPEDKQVATTLVEGSIALQPLSGNVSQLMLTPGHQSLFDKQSHATRVKSVDTEVATSWRTGSFVFEDQTLGEIMQTLSRWYDFDYTFSDKQLASVVFMGSVPRYGQFADVVQILEVSGGLRIRQKGRDVTISKK